MLALSPLGALLGLPGFAREPGLRLGGGPTEEMLVMFAFFLANAVYGLIQWNRLARRPSPDQPRP